MGIVFCLKRVFNKPLHKVNGRSAAAIALFVKVWSLLKVLVHKYYELLSSSSDVINLLLRNVVKWSGTL